MMLDMQSNDALSRQTRCYYYCYKGCAQTKNSDCEYMIDC